MNKTLVTGEEAHLLTSVSGVTLFDSNTRRVPLQSDFHMIDLYKIILSELIKDITDQKISSYNSPPLGFCNSFFLA